MQSFTYFNFHKNTCRWDANLGYPPLFLSLCQINGECSSFQSLDLLKSRPAHLAVFLHHVVSQFDPAPLVNMNTHSRHQGIIIPILLIWWAFCGLTPIWKMLLAFFPLLALLSLRWHAQANQLKRKPTLLHGVPLTLYRSSGGTLFSCFFFLSQFLFS